MSNGADQNVDQKLDQFFQKAIDKRQVEKANAFKTAPTGPYNIQFDQVTPLVGDNPKMESQFERLMVKCAANLYGFIDGATEPRKLGRAFVDLSPEERTWAESGDQDGPSRLWGQAVKALILSGALPGDKEKGVMTEEIPGKYVVEALAATALRVYVIESFKHPETQKKTTINDGDTRAEVKKLGLNTRNDIVTISVYREDNGK